VVVNRHVQRLLLRLYPRAWRDRYGAEVTALTDELVAGGDTTGRHAGLNLLAGAVAERGRALLRGGRPAVPTVLLLAASAAPLLAVRVPRGSVPRPYFSSHAAVGAVLVMVTLGWFLVECMVLLHARQTEAWQRFRDTAVPVPVGGWRAAAVICTVSANGWLYLGPAFVPAASIRYAAAASAVGIALVVTGVAVRLWSLAARTPYLTAVTPRISADQPVPTGGPYRLVRYPHYAGGLLACAGYGAASGNWIGLAAITLLPLAVGVWRIRVEDRALLATVGDRYRGYADRHKALVPGVW
jgi:protein-S-isoprenylcysteine O-methyltransferase Ste14